MPDKNIAAGQVWQIRGSRNLGLIVCVFEDEEFGDDLRVLPVFVGPTYVALATERDVVIPRGQNDLDADILVMCSNAQSLSHEDLAQTRGTVAAEALKAARAFEMKGIIPGVEIQFRQWSGLPDEQQSEPSLTARRELFRIWDDLRSQLIQFRDTAPIGLSNKVFRAARLFRGTGYGSLGGYADALVSSNDVTYFDYGSGDVLSATTAKAALCRAAQAA